MSSKLQSASVGERVTSLNEVQSNACIDSVVGGNGILDVNNLVCLRIGLDLITCANGRW